MHNVGIHRIGIKTAALLIIQQHNYAQMIIIITTKSKYMQ